MAAATAEEVHEVGREALTVQATCRRAGIGRSGYYELFDGLVAALAYAHQCAFELASEPLRASAALERPFPDRLAAAISGLYARLAAEPLVCELCLVHSFGAPEAVGCDQPALVGLVARGLADRGELPGGGSEPGVREDLVAGMIVSLGAERLRLGEARRLAREVEPTVALALSLLLGSE